MNKYWITAKQEFEFRFEIEAESLDAAKTYAEENREDFESFSSNNLVHESFTVEPVTQPNRALDGLRKAAREECTRRGQSTDWICTATVRELEACLAFGVIPETEPFIYRVNRRVKK